MTRTTNARIAGFTFLLYIAAGLASMAVFGRATSGEGIAAKLASLAQHATDLRVVVMLTLLTSFCALILGVTLYALTREQDADLAMLALVCRVVEGVNGATSIPRTLGLLSLATASGASAADRAAAETLGAFLLRGGGASVSAIFFGVASTLFSWLLLRGRMIPAWMAWLGVVSSLLVVVALPLQLFGVLAANWLVWMPLLAFELAFAGWLIVKGVAPPARQAALPR